MAQLRRAHEKFLSAGAQVVLVSMGEPEEAEAFRTHSGVSYPIVCDPDKSIYRAFGLKVGSIYHIFSPRIFLRGLRTVSQGHLPGLPQGDPFQLSGVFVIGQQGLIRFAYYSRDPSDHPSVDTIISAIP